VRESASPYPVGLLVLNRVGEALQFDGAFGAERFGNLDGVFPGLFLREVLGEENVWDVFAWRTADVFDGFGKFAVALMSAVTHNLILEEDTDGS